MKALIHLVLVSACPLCSAARGDTCRTEATCEVDAGSFEDADAIGASVSLMQQDVPRLLKRTLKSEIQPLMGVGPLAQLTQKAAMEWPEQTVRCSEKQVMRTKHMTFADYDGVVASVHRLYERLPVHCTAEDCPRSDWTGCILRLAAHDFMDYNLREGGSDGCLFLQDGDNAGLNNCLAGENRPDDHVRVGGLLDAYEEFCSRISLADFLVIGAEAVMNITRQNVLKDEPHRTKLDLRARFKFGRVTNSRCNNSIGRMPNAEMGCDAVQETMITNMGLTWKQSAALMGAHTIGQASPNRSGYKGRWVTAQSSLRFDNDYYTSMILKGWAPERNVLGNAGKNQWKRVDIGVNEYLLGTEMMLDSDMCLYHSPSDFRIGRNLLHAKSSGNEGCNCAWVRPLDHVDAIAKNQNVFCGTTQIYPGNLKLGFGTAGHMGIPNENTLNFTKQRQICCGMQDDVVINPKIDCGLPNAPKGDAAAAVALFARDEDAWLASYYEAWDIATSNGYSSLSKLSAT